MNNVFSSIHFDRSDTVDGMLNGIEQVLQHHPKSLLLLIGSESALELGRIRELLARQPVPAFAAVMPSLVLESQWYSSGVLICGLKPVVSTHLFTDIDRPEEALAGELADALSQVEAASSAMLILDGASPGVDGFIHCVHDRLGPDFKVAGCGSGYADLSPRPSIITPAGVLKNAALLSFLPAPLAMGVRHGWQALAGPFLVTQSQGNVIKSINYRPAFSFYRAVVQRHAGVSIRPDDFYTDASRFPFGLEQLDSEYLVRDPLELRGDSIVCAGEVPANAMVHVLRGEQEQLLQAAREAAESLSGNVSDHYDSERSLYIMMIDCFSRRIALGDDFDMELASVRSALPDSARMMGVLSLGEIASSRQGLIRFLNKSIVLLGLAK